MTLQYHNHQVPIKRNKFTSVKICDNLTKLVITKIGVTFEHKTEVTSKR